MTRRVTCDPIYHREDPGRHYFALLLAGLLYGGSDVVLGILLSMRAISVRAEPAGISMVRRRPQN
jgi:hypothetical protein